MMTHPSYALLYVADPAASATFYADLFDTRPVDVSPAFALFALDDFCASQAVRAISA